MVQRGLLAVILILLVPGCFTEEAPTVAPAAAGNAGGVAIDAARPDTSFKEVETGPAAMADLNATLEAPPRLVAGEWWRLKFTSGLSGDIDVVRVVAAVEDEAYLIGMPHEGWFKEAVAYHSPALGDVNLDLSYMTHNMRFEPLRFPLVAGNTWETHFAASPLIAKVESTTETTATVVFTIPEDTSNDPMMPIYEAFGLTFGGEAMRLVYDASIHEVSRFESFIGAYEVADHGYGFEGWITIPRGHNTAIDYGTFGPVTPGSPPLTRDILINGGFNRMTLMQGVFPVTTGSYSVRAVAPDGIEYRTAVTGDKPIFQFFESTAVDGTWTSEDIVAGIGATFSMGIAYHQYDIRLPDGIRRSDHAHEVIR